MLTASELQKIGEEVSNTFVTNGTSLTTCLEKIAGQRGLNKQQISRAAEVANTTTYLRMIKTAKDKYVEFPLADSAIIYANIEKSLAKAASGDSSDYASSPRSEKERNLFKLFKVATEDPLEPQKKKSALDVSLQKEAICLKAKIEFVTNHLQEKLANFENDYEKLFFLTKQAVLQNIPFSYPETIIKTAGEIISESLIMDFKQRLTRIAPHISLDDEKVAQINGSGAQSVAVESLIPNKNSVLYKLAASLQNQLIYVAKMDNALDTLVAKVNTYPGQNMQKYAIQVVRPLVGGLVSTIIKHPIMAGVVVIASVAKGKGKKEGKYEQGVILQKSLMRKRPGGTR